MSSTPGIASFTLYRLCVCSDHQPVAGDLGVGSIRQRRVGTILIGLRYVYMGMVMGMGIVAGGTGGNRGSEQGSGRGCRALLTHTYSCRLISQSTTASVVASEDGGTAPPMSRLITTRRSSYSIARRSASW